MPQTLQLVPAVAPRQDEIHVKDYEAIMSSGTVLQNLSPAMLRRRLNVGNLSFVERY